VFRRALVKDYAEAANDRVCEVDPAEPAESFAVWKRGIAVGAASSLWRPLVCGKSRAQISLGEAAGFEGGGCAASKTDSLFIHV
jgi:hypothetical protein